MASSEKVGSSDPTFQEGKTTFPSWEEAWKALQDFAQKNNFAWSTVSSASIQNANKHLLAAGDATPFNANLKRRNIKLACSCGGPRRINQGEGITPFQSTWKIFCPVTAQLIAKSKTALTLTKWEVTKHNHVCDKQFYDTLPSTRHRLLQSAEVVSKDVTLMMSAGAKPGRIRSILRSGGVGQITQRDLVNFRCKMKEENLRGMNMEEKLVDVLEKLLKADEGAYVSVSHVRNEFQYLFIQTSRMKETAQRFGSVLFMDTTYKMNKNQMPVSVLMVMDGNGNGRAVGYAFLANETAETYSAMLKDFRGNVGEELSEKTQTFLIDKDPAQAKSIKEVYPEVDIQLCDFHVSNTFSKRSAKEPPRVKEIIDTLRFTSDDEDFEILVAELEKTASQQFFAYFKENWISCPLSWSRRDKKMSINLEQNTTNLVENHNAKLKMILRADHELYQSVESLIELVRNKEEDVLTRSTMDSVKDSYVMNCEDATVNAIRSDLTTFGTRVVLWEMNESENESLNTNKLQTTSSSCTCSHWRGLFLPCRHIFACRRNLGLDLYDKALVNKRWFKKYNVEFIFAKCR